MSRAMELLRESRRPVTEICFDVGFNSLGAFTRTFREIVAEPPGTDCALRDPFGNAIRFTQPPPEGANP